VHTKSNHIVPKTQVFFSISTSIIVNNYEGAGRSQSHEYLLVFYAGGNISNGD